MTEDLVDEKIEHRPTVDWDGGPQAYRASCSCGWVDLLLTSWRAASVERAAQLPHPQSYS